MKSLVICCALLFLCDTSLSAAELRAGAAKVDITDVSAGRVNDPLFAKALVLRSGDTTLVLVTIDAVAIGEIGRIGNGFMAEVRAALQKELGIPPASIVINASHCHGIVRADTAGLTIEAVKNAWQRLVPARVGAGVVKQSQISENRRLQMKDGSEVDMRRAYSLPRDEDVASVGPIDPQVGLLRIDRADGTPLAAIYNFACHPIMNPPHQGNSADFPGFASRVIEQSLGHGALAFFVQGCCGDINPVRYKDVMRPASAEPLGLLLGASVVEGLNQIRTAPAPELNVTNEMLSLPRGTDLARRIAAIDAEQLKLVRTLQPTDINFKTFLPLYIQHKVSPEFPAMHAQGYLHDKLVGRDDLVRLDAANRKQIDAYLNNLAVMERMTRLNVNQALLRKHLAQNEAAGSPTLDVELCGIRVGDFRLLTFPGELTVQVGLNIKSRAPGPFAFVAGYTNGYIYYLPTERQRNNTGYAQEDCDCLVAPEWQKLFEKKAVEILVKL